MTHTEHHAAPRRPRRMAADMGERALEYAGSLRDWTSHRTHLVARLAHDYGARLVPTSLVKRRRAAQRREATRRLIRAGAAYGAGQAIRWASDAMANRRKRTRRPASASHA